MTVQTPSISCPITGHRCEIRSCVQNPYAPECVQISRRQEELATIKGIGIQGSMSETELRRYLKGEREY
jgi:hypothetical protein